jgi:hypothetical protein
MPRLEGSDYARTDSQAPAQARALALNGQGRRFPLSKRSIGIRLSLSLRTRCACAGACESLSTDEGGTAYGGKSPTQNGEEPFFWGEMGRFVSDA